MLVVSFITRGDSPAFLGRGGGGGVQNWVLGKSE